MAYAGLKPVWPDWATFERSWCPILLGTKVAQIWGDTCGYFEKYYFLSNNYFLGNHFGGIGLLFIPSSGPTDWI